MAERLSSILEDDGWSVWWDRKLAIGQRVFRRIDQELADARCVVVIWSLTSCESHWVETESSEGLERGILVPVQIQKCRIPFQFRQLNTADLMEWDLKNLRHAEIIKVRESVRVLLDESGEREAKEDLAGLAGVDESRRTGLRKVSSDQPGTIDLFVPYLDIEMEDIAENEGDFLPPETIVSGPSTRLLFEFSEESILWIDLYKYLKSLGQTEWLEELGRAIYRARNARSPGVLELQFRATTNDRVYRPVLYTSMALTGSSKRFRILFLEQKEDRLPPSTPSNIVLIQSLVNNAFEFRYRVIEPFLRVFNEGNEDNSVELLTDLRKKIISYEKVTSRRGFLDTNNLMSICSESSDKESVLGLFQQYYKSRQSLFVAIENQNERGVNEELEILSGQYKQFLDILLRSYQVAISRI
ncbi:toll/interleukin-1 receptor domain-containing protein [Candidatus Thiodiazotropha sp. CDECU1]|uniref:toll/interleukin-1 receptor domain-containing protein n=1 Tax=Candidatus Thiodiazotropha sp. CDECU1 TaxID=3065865 RepID=UPI002930D988|nr:toll/interleukin-1 receptor domain-containing protein [Candidatus Thiodiazotropha sp. CDECU1]